MTRVRRLEGKVAIVTGASAGIGAAIAHRLAAEGARVVGVGRRGEPGAELVAALGGPERARFVAGSVADPQTVGAAVGAAREWGGPQVLVNNAGIDHTGSVLDTALDEVREVFETNFFGALLMLQAAGRAMVDHGGGSIVNVTSRLASIGVPTMALYGASKGALLALTRGAAVELAPLGIRVNAVAPGQTRTPLTEAWLAQQTGPEAGEAAVAGIPQRRFGEPEEVAATVAFLAADESAHITGASIPVDGGYTAA
ncbi:MAG: SDR family NAD(P)-dependent oxidoreductase [Solirubrobacteraceae bacterium]